MKDAKYLIAYVGPVSAYFAIYFAGPLSFLTLFISFFMIPALEFFTPNSKKNFTEEEEKVKLSNHFFDALLYFNLPLHFGLLAYYFYSITTNTYAGYELYGMTMSVGMIVGSIGINVAHELGHRAKKYEQNMSKALLMTALYMHFFIEHNRGHHKNVATDLDPASARKGEILYSFWFKSLFGSYRSAWKLETQRLEQKSLAFWSFDNQMINFHLIQLAYLGTIGFFFGPVAILFALAVAFVGILQLETVNYIEHYGLRRKLKENSI